MFFWKTDRLAFASGPAQYCYRSLWVCGRQAIIADFGDGSWQIMIMAQEPAVMYSLNHFTTNLLHAKILAYIELIFLIAAP
jgi:hypothetical protein